MLVSLLPSLYVPLHIHLLPAYCKHSNSCLGKNVHILTLTANPQRMGLPMNTALAPNARAFNTSVPCLTPPSKKTSTLPFTSLTTSDNTSI